MMASRSMCGQCVVFGLCFVILMIARSSNGTTEFCNQFRCDGGLTCVPLPWVCDDSPDCADGSDEYNCPNRTACESPDDFLCFNEHHCIPMRWTCDGERDCADGSDELTCPSITCDEDHVSCGEGKPCVHKSFLCDGHVDCPGGLDEQATTCESRPCEGSMFRCTTGQCISERWKCDGDLDCNDESDEQSCPEFTCAADHYKCSTSHQCIPAQWKCDGAFDCGDLSDEMNCTHDSAAPSPCSNDEFWCKTSNECVHASWHCDGDKDCADSSDEFNCPVKTCRSDEHQCRTAGNCIQLSWKCDGTAQCDDRSDEEDCSYKSCNAQTEFDCNASRNVSEGRVVSSRNCIPVRLLCDHKNDCGANEDEAPAICSRNRTSSCSVRNGGCQQLCRQRLESTYCQCRAGYELADDNHSCNDVDECQTGDHSCSQVCENTKGSYKCRCRPEYDLDPINLMECHAKGSEPFLIFSNRHDLRELRQRSHRYRPLVEGLRTAKALDYDVRSRVLFWSDAAYENISRAEISESGSLVKQEVVLSGIKSAEGLAYDWVHSALYWTDSVRGHIGVLKIGGASSSVRAEGESVRRTLVEGLSEPKAIVLDPRTDRRRMYWTEYGKDPKVMQSSMDGSDLQIIGSAASDVILPLGLTIDYDSDMLYWSDAKLHIIVSYGLKSHMRRVVFTSYTYLRHPYALAIFEDYLYWTDWSTGSIYKRSTSLSSFSSSNVTRVIQQLSSPMDIRVFHPLNQPMGENACSSAPCSHICLPRYQYPQYSCSCPDTQSNVSPYRLIDGTTCQQSGTGTSPAQAKSTSTQSGIPSTSSSQDTGSTSPVPSNLSSRSPADLVGSDVSSSSGVTTIIVGVVVTVVVMVLVVLMFVVVRRFVRRSARKAMNFENPVYRKRAEDQFVLDKNLIDRVDSRMPSMREHLIRDQASQDCIVNAEPYSRT